MVFGGGTLLNAYKSSKTLLLITFIIFIARILKVKVYGVGLGIGKIESLSSKILVKYILTNFDNLGLRDKKSFDIAKSIADNMNIELTADISFNRKHTSYKKLNKNKVIAISMVEAFVDSDKYKFIIDMIYQTVLYCQSNGYIIKFYSFQEGSYSDSKVFQNMIDKYAFQNVEIEYINILDNNLDFKFQNIDIFIGMRFHGLVLSAINGTPFIGFSTDHKVFDICDKYSMPYSNMDNISYDWLVQSINLVKNIVIDDNIEKELTLLSKKNWTFLNEKEGD
ncbi:polysaccharide pyruvyl transferase family protein [Aliarcobacter butzleri]|uniref:polysaccharide pyruvyl transferase family protein n=1 Tax=Aliarcobacter butzleri TaxID=28197 RepID=UPI003AFAF12D